MFRLAIPVVRSACLPRSFSTTRSVLAGHNKWSKIKEKKGVNDAQKGQLLSRVSRDIAVAIRTGGGSADPKLNSQLAAVIKQAKSQNVPKDNIERAIERAQSKNKKGEIVTYEALAFGSVGIVIESLSDNPNRTIANLREIFNDHGVQKASVMYMFKKLGCVGVELPEPVEGSESSQDEMDILTFASQYEVEDFDIVDIYDEGKQIIKLYCPPHKLMNLADGLLSKPARLTDHKIVYVPTSGDAPIDEESQEKLEKLLERLWADEDTLNIWTTIDKV